MSRNISKSKKIIRSVEIKDDDFYGMKLPKLKHFEFVLSTKVRSSHNNGELLSYQEDFSIKIINKDIMKSKIEDLSSKLSEILKRKVFFNPTLDYYTYEMEENVKKDLFQKIIDTVSNFDNNYDESKMIDLNEQKDFIDFCSDNNLENNYFKIIYNDNKEYPEASPEFIIIAKDYMGKEKFIELVRPSINSDKVKFTKIASVVDKKLLNKIAFVYPLNEYKFVQNIYSKMLEEDKNLEIENNSKLKTDKDKYEALNYDKKNWLNFFIEFSEQEKGFYFYITGYKPKDTRVRLNCIEKIARNIVIVQGLKYNHATYNVQNQSVDEEKFKKDYPYKIRQDVSYRYESVNSDIIPEVSEIKDKSQRMKIFVPLSDYNILKLFREKYMKFENLFTRKLNKETDIISYDSHFYLKVDHYGKAKLVIGKDALDKSIFLSFEEFEEFKNCYLKIDPYMETRIEDDIISYHIKDFEQGYPRNKINEQVLRRFKLADSFERVEKKEILKKKI